MDNKIIADRYEIIKSIGNGGMADVYLALDTLLNRNVAIKLMRSDMSDDAVSVLRFEREAKAVADLNHPNIVEIYDIGKINGRPFMVMEYVKGVTLKELLKRRGALDTKEAVDIEKQLVLATKAAHDKGIIHRDIKPQNMIIKADGTVKMMDFGIALAKDSIQLTHSDSVMGTVHYLAPELVKGESASIQSDIYALGIVLFEMLTGDVPFKADTPLNICLKHLNDPIPSVRKYNPNIPQSLENIVLLATAKNKYQRYSSCQLMYEALSKCLKIDNEQPIKFSSDSGENDGFDDLTSLKKMKDTKRAKAIAIKRRKRKIVKVTKILIGLLIVICVAGFILASGVFSKKEDSSVTLENLVGKNITEVKEIIEQQGLLLDNNDITYELSDDVEKGLVISQEPSSGTTLEKGDNISVVVSSGVKVTIPDFTGWLFADVQTWASDYKNLTVTYVEDNESDASKEAESGTVISQSQLNAGDSFNPDVASSLTIVYKPYVSFIMPDYVGYGLGEAEEILQALGAKVTLVPLYDDNTYNEESGVIPWVVVKSEPEVGESYTQSTDNSVKLYYYPDSE